VKKGSVNKIVKNKLNECFSIEEYIQQANIYLFSILTALKVKKWNLENYDKYLNISRNSKYILDTDEYLKIPRKLLELYKTGLRKWKSIRRIQ